MPPLYQQATFRFEVFSGLSTARLAADGIGCNASISACGRGHWQLSLLLLSSMLPRSLVPDEISYGSAISSCAKAGEWQLALQLLSDMTAAEVLTNLVILNSAISACEKQGEWQVALQLLQDVALARTVFGKGKRFSSPALWEWGGGLGFGGLRFRV